MPEQDYKRCPRCGETKPVTDYYKRADSERPHSHCKECMKESHSRNARANRERVTATARSWRAAHREKVNASARNRRRGKRDLMREEARRARERNPEKVRARNAVTNAVKDGRLVKPDRCEGCKSPLEARFIHGHHEDYSRPLEVEWLCKDCHLQRHWPSA